jgi:hypothetical protein
VRNKRGELFELSVFVASYSHDREHAFLTIPLIRAQCKVASDLLHNIDGRGWTSVKLLNSIRGSATYADGLSENGESMFLDIPDPDMNARIAELEHGEHDEEEEFQAHQATPTSSKEFVEEASLLVKTVWKQHAEQITGIAGMGGSLKSPGKLVVGKTIQLGELAAALGKDVFKDGQVGCTSIVNSKKNTGKNVVEKKNKLFCLF